MVRLNSGAQFFQRLELSLTRSFFTNGVRNNLSTVALNAAGSSKRNQMRRVLDVGQLTVLDVVVDLDRVLVADDVVIARPAPASVP